MKSCGIWTHISDDESHNFPSPFIVGFMLFTCSYHVVGVHLYSSICTYTSLFHHQTFCTSKGTITKPSQKQKGDPHHKNKKGEDICIAHILQRADSQNIQHSYTTTTKVDNPIKIWTRELKKHLPKENSPMSYKHMESYRWSWYHSQYICTSNLGTCDLLQILEALCD